MHFPARASFWILLVLTALAESALAQKTAKVTPIPSPAPVPPEAREIVPPFSLMWHEPSERLEAKIEAAKLTIAERRKIENHWVVSAVGFKKPNAADPKSPTPPELRRVLFHFEGGSISKEKGVGLKVRETLAGGQLVEVELQYEQEGWDEEQYNTCLGEKRRMLERLYGKGQQFVRSSQPTPDGKATQRIVGYKWNRNNTAVELIYFTVSVNAGERAFHTLSLHYKRS
jgi:hypothetical protein